MLNNQRGLAIFEIVPILVIFILLFNFAFGLFGAIHSGILNSIAARNYAFETFRNRTSLNYLRDVKDSEFSFSYMKSGFRYHGTVSEGSRGDKWTATKRNIKFSESRNTASVDDSATHDTKVLAIASSGRASDVIPEGQFNSIWVRTLYGICLNKQCGE